MVAHRSKEPTPGPSKGGEFGTALGPQGNVFKSSSSPLWRGRGWVLSDEIHSYQGILWVVGRAGCPSPPPPREPPSIRDNLDSQKDFRMVHPEQDQPERHDHARAQHQRLVGRAEHGEEMFAEVALERGADETFEQAVHAVDRNGVHADDNQRERPSASLPDIDDRVERPGKTETPPAAEQRPPWRPNA